MNEKGKETPLKGGDFALAHPDEKYHYRNKGDHPLKMICGVPKEFESSLSNLVFQNPRPSSLPVFLI